MKIKHGTTRTAILIGKFAFKIPILHRSLKHFAKGWLSNIDERSIWRIKKHDKLCPIYFSILGLINIMPLVIVPRRYAPFSKEYIFDYFKELDINIDVCSGWRNFGFYNDRLVIIDYAIHRESGKHCSDCDEDCILKNG